MDFSALHAAFLSRSLCTEGYCIWDFDRAPICPGDPRREQLLPFAAEPYKRETIFPVAIKLDIRIVAAQIGSVFVETLEAAYAHATDGIIFDGEQEKFVTPDEARRIVHELEYLTPAQRAAMDQVRREFGFDPWPEIGVKNSK